MDSKEDEITQTNKQVTLHHRLRCPPVTQADRNHITALTVFI